MDRAIFEGDIKGVRFHFVGAKGTGMTALAEICVRGGAILTGSDVPDIFYTDEILAALGMRVSTSFSADNILPDTKYVVYSDAYSRESNPELIEAARRGIPLLSYAQALGMLSRLFDSSGIAGVHGKTTTTAMTGTILKALALPATVLAGSSVASFGNRCTLTLGNEYFVAETDEYRGHFFNFSPKRILLTSVESDHQDFFPTYESIRDAFVNYVVSLPEEGTLIYCADDPGASEVMRRAGALRKDIQMIPYGISAEGDWRIHGMEMMEGQTKFFIEACAEAFMLRVPGTHLALDAAGALALAMCLSRAHAPGDEPDWASARMALESFTGSRRRSELLGDAGGILFMDDYAHHPTALSTTIEGIKKFWPGRRLVVDFMSHTYSRTAALMDQFAGSFGAADCLVLHGIYASARETTSAGVNGKLLFGKVRLNRPDLTDVSGLQADGIPEPEHFILYSEKPGDAEEALLRLLRPGDLFITMGAGDNWKLGKRLLDRKKTGA